MIRLPLEMYLENCDSFVPLSSVRILSMVIPCVSDTEIYHIDMFSVVIQTRDLTLFQATNFRHFQTGRLCRRQFQV